MKKSIPLFKVYMSETVKNSITQVLYSGYVGQGPVVEEFEEKLRNYFNSDYVITTNSGTSAEHLAIHLLKQPDRTKNWPGLTENDEVLTSPFSCTATNWPILANNLRIKWVDIDPNNLNIDLVDLARKFTPKTKLCIFVHFGGYPIDLDAIASIQNNVENMYGFRPLFIEDCAHAFGSLYNNKLLGNHGNVCMFSLQAIKHINSIDGGVLILPDSNLYHRAKLVRWYGIDRETNSKDFRCEANISEWGFKFHMNDVNASVGIENLKCVNKIIGKHRDNAEYYYKNLEGIDGITLLENAPNRTGSYWLFPILVKKKADFISYMKDNGVMTSQVHERNDIHSCVEGFKRKLPNLDTVISSVVSIPVGWWVSDSDREYIVNLIKDGW